MIGNETARACLAEPNDLGPGAGQMRTGHLRGLLGLVQSYSGDARAILERHEINPIRFSDPDNYVDCSAAVSALEHCSHVFRDPLFGARLARGQSVDVFGCVAALGRAAPTFREGLRCFRDYLPVMHSREGALEFAETKRHAEHRWTGEGVFATNIQGNYQSLILQLKMLHMLAGPGFQPDYVALTANVPRRDADELERWVGCRIEVRQPHNAIGFAAELLEQAVPTSNKWLFTLLTRHLDDIRDAATPSLSERVSAYIRNALPTGNCSLQRCAEAFGIGRRVLQCQLDAERQSFTDIVETERMTRARRLLEDGSLSMVEIAGQLGYSEQSSFGRACRRWFGTAPGVLRRERPRHH